MRAAVGYIGPKSPIFTAKDWYSIHKPRTIGQDPTEDVSTRSFPAEHKRKRLERRLITRRTTRDTATPTASSPPPSIKSNNFLKPINNNVVRVREPRASFSVSRLL